MGEYIHLLITTYSTFHGLLRSAVAIKRDAISEDCLECPMEYPYNLELEKHLPQHVRTAGKIIQVDQIFNVSVSALEKVPTNKKKGVE